MKRADYLWLYLAALVPLVIVAWFQRAPGYMDADYYTLSAMQIGSGKGFSEPILWNYLDEPQGLPHPSHVYWQPLPSLIAVPSIFAGWMAGLGFGFAAGRVPFILMAAAAAPLATALAWRLARRRQLALLAGGLAVLPGFYLPYLTTIETFAPSLVLGGMFFFVALNPPHSRSAIAFLGTLAGLMSLNRAEGLLWLAAAAYVAWRGAARKRDALLVLAGFLLIMAPWYARNLFAFGSPLAAGAARTAWLTSYDQLFAYSAGGISFGAWLASGWRAIAGARLAALGQNLSSAVIVEGFVVLTPLIIWGGLKKFKLPAVRAAIGLWMAIFLAMSLVFPFSGARGGFFHAVAGLQTMAWALAAVGQAAFVEWGAARRGWNATKALRIFAVAVLAVAAGLSAYAATARLPVWNVSAQTYTALGERLDDLGVSRDAIVMVNNPPGFANAAHRSAIVIPDGGVGESLAAARRYGASVLLLEANHPAGWDTVYANPQILSSIQFIESIDGTHIFFLP
jgi:hypothetical protein